MLFGFENPVKMIISPYKFYTNSNWEDMVAV